MTPSVHLLFDELHGYLGELFAEDGAFSHLTLNPKGEEALGERFEEWQTRGVPEVRDIVTAGHESTAYTHDGRVLVRDRAFVGALRSWFEAHGYTLLPMSVEALDCWECVLQLPLEPDERFALAADLSLVPIEELGAWKRTLQDAVEAADLAMV
jgi:hypothetical protein